MRRWRQRPHAESGEGVSRGTSCIFASRGFSRERPSDHTVAGKILLADLSTLIEFLSDTLSIKLDEAAATGDVVLSMEEVSRSFRCHRKRFSSGASSMADYACDMFIRMGGGGSGSWKRPWRMFAADNRERVEKSATFKQLSDEERKQIIELARRFSISRGGGCGIR